MSRNEREDRLGEIKYNKQKCLMKIVGYNSSHDIIVEFQDEHKEKVHTNYKCFESGSVKNPYFPSIFGVGILGTKYSSKKDKVIVKEYRVWYDMLQRCYDDKYKKEHPTYQNAICCNEWLNYENFYEWIHSQKNFEKWLKGERWAIDKDILVKHNRIYSPDTCCLVPQNVNSLFITNKKVRGSLPIGVIKLKNGFRASCKNPFTNKNQWIDLCETEICAFQQYKTFKENIIKQIAQIEYDKGNIIEKCYQAMMNYIVEIDD